MNPRALRIASVALAIAGCAVAGYLTWVHYEGIIPACVGGSGGCERVQTSVYSEVAGLPVAVVGLAAYATALGALLSPRPTGRLVAAGVGLSAFGFSLYLTYVELFVIDAICQWCVASAVIATGLAVTTTLLALRTPSSTT